MFGIVQQVAMYLSASAKRLETFRDVDNASEVDDMPDRHTLRKLSDTRWGSRCDALSNTAFKQLYQTVKSFAAFVDIQENMPRTVGRQSYRSTVPSSSPEEYWRRSMYFPFLDHLIEEIQSRLLSPELEKYYSVQYLLPHNVSHLSNDQKVKEIYTAYSADLPRN